MENTRPFQVSTAIRASAAFLNLIFVLARAAPAASLPCSYPIACLTHSICRLPLAGPSWSFPAIMPSSFKVRTAGACALGFEGALCVLEQGPANVSCRGPESKCFRLHEPHSSCHNYCALPWTLVSVRVLRRNRSSRIYMPLCLSIYLPIYLAYIYLET